jgi:cysteine protease ATG4
MRVHLTYEGGNVYSDTFLSTAVVDGVFRPTLLLVVTRLGVDSINPIYWDALKATLQMPQTVGIAGYIPPPSSHTSANPS